MGSLVRLYSSYSLFMNGEWTLFERNWRNDRKSFGNLFFCNSKRTGCQCPLPIGHHSNSYGVQCSVVLLHVNFIWWTMKNKLNLSLASGKNHLQIPQSFQLDWINALCVYSTAEKFVIIKPRWIELKCMQFNEIDQINGTEIKTKCQTIFIAKCILHTEDSQVAKS